MARAVPITLDKPRNLRYDLNAIALIGEKLNLTIRLAHLQEDLFQQGFPLRALRTVIWAGLLHEDSSLTEEFVGGLVDAENLREVMSAFFGLFGSSVPLARDPNATTAAGTTSPSPSPGSDSKI